MIDVNPDVNTITKLNIIPKAPDITKAVFWLITFGIKRAPIKYINTIAANV